MSNEPAHTSSHFPALDALRGIAVLLVVLHHIQVLHPRGAFGFLGLDVFEAGFIGVDIFFVLSGFLITQRLLAECTRNGRPGFLRFWRARALRLLPALVFFLAVFLVYSAATGWPGAGSPEVAVSSSVAALTFTANWKAIWDPERLAWELAHLWSLAIEEQFYLVWPIALAAVMSSRRLRRALPWLIGASVVLLGFWKSHVYSTGPWGETYLRTDTRMDGLLAGAFVAAIVAAGWRRPAWLRWATPTALAVIAIVFVVLPDANSALYHQGGASLIAVSTGVIILAVVSGWQAPRWILENRGLRVVGRLSFGIYLWHVLVFIALDRFASHWNQAVLIPVALILTAAGVVVSWFGIERPAQAWRRRLDAAPRRTTGSATAIRHRPAIVLCALGAVTLIVGIATARISMSTEPGAALPHVAQLRALSYLTLNAEPPAAHFLAAALINESPATYSTGSILLSVLRLPVAAVDTGLAAWMLPVSIAIAWLVATIVGWKLARSWRGGGRVTTRAAVNTVAGASFLVPVVLVWRGADQSWEPRMWMLASSTVILAALVQLRRAPTRGSWIAAVAAVLLAALSHAVLGWVAFVILIAMVGAAWLRDTPRRQHAAGAIACATVFVALVAVPFEGRQGAAAPISAGYGHDLPAPQFWDQLYVRNRCPEMYSSALLFGPVWETGSRPAAWFDLRFNRQPSRRGQAAVLRFANSDGAGVDVESDGRRLRFVGVELDDAAQGRWWTLMNGRSVTLVVALTDGTYVVRVNGEVLGELKARVPGADEDRYPRVALTDLRAAIGTQPRIKEMSTTPAELCDAVFGAAAGSLQFTSALPGTSTRGETIAVGSCDAIVRGSGDPAEPWEIQAVRPFVAEVGLDADAGPGVTPISAATSTGDIVVSVETDGGGQARFRFDVPYFPILGEWFDIGALPRRTLRIAYSPDDQAHLVTVDDEVLARVPLSTVTDEMEGDRLATTFWFARAYPRPGELVRGVEVVEAEQFPPELCLERGRIDDDLTSGPDLPFALSVGDLYAAPACGALLTGARDGKSPWDVLEVARLHAAVSINEPASNPAVVELIDVADEPRIVDVDLEVDGAGRGRIVTSSPYVTSRGPWFDMVVGDTIDVVLDTRMHRGVYVVVVDGAETARVPIVLDEDLFGFRLFTVPRLLEGDDEVAGTSTGFRPMTGRAPLCAAFEPDDD